MSSELTNWIAGVREYRLALIVAIAGSLALILLLAAPSWFLPTSSSTDNRTRIRSPGYGLPSELAQPPAVKLKITPQAKKAPSKASRPPPSVSYLTKSKHSLKSGYYVQVSAFRDVSRAIKQVRRLRQIGWHAQTVIKKNSLHAVLVGPWPTRAHARNGQQKLARKNKLKGFIVQR